MAPKSSKSPTIESWSNEDSGRVPLLLGVDEDVMDHEGELEKWGSPARWQTSTQKDANQKLSRENLKSELSIDEKRHPSDYDEPKTPNEWSTSADAPLLTNADGEEDGDDEEEEGKGSIQGKEEKGAPVVGGAEYKVAFSHFGVSFQSQDHLL